MADTVFYRLNFDRNTFERLRELEEERDAEMQARLTRPFQATNAYGCFPFGRSDRGRIRSEGSVHPTLARTCVAVSATQRGHDFAPIWYGDEATLDPFLIWQTATLLSRDRRVLLIISHYERGADEDLFYACLSARADGKYLLTRGIPAEPLDPPSWEVEGTDALALKPIVERHARRLAGVSVLPFTAAAVPELVLALDREYGEHNEGKGWFVPLTRWELRRVREALGVWTAGGPVQDVFDRGARGGTDLQKDL
jgi:hypothetical protein